MYNNWRTLWYNHIRPQTYNNGLNPFEARYNEDSDSKIKQIVKSNDKFYYTTNWLETFNNWENFVKQNYFDVYLEKNNTPSKLWENHVLERTELPEIGIEFLNYLKSVNYLIEKRGKQIHGVN